MLQCHLGSKEKFVDHEMIAAGTRIFISNWILFPR